MSPGAKSRSLELQPTQGPLRAFVSAQFCTKPQSVPLTPETSLAGKTALLTGGTTGLGLHAARHLLSLNLSRLILAVRSPEKGDAVAAQLRADFPLATVEVWPLEMSSYPSIQALAQRAATEFSRDNRLDIAILNAGIVHQEFTVCKTTGHCEVIQVNYLSTVLLALLLLPVLRRKPSPAASGKPIPSRLTIVGSGVALAARLPNKDKRPFLSSFDNLSVQSWDIWERYSASKLLGHLFLIKLLEQLPENFSDEVVVNIVDPGYCKGSELHRGAHGAMSAILSLSKALTGRTLDEGAWTYIDAAVAKGKESHGCFLMDWEIKP